MPPGRPVIPAWVRRCPPTHWRWPPCGRRSNSVMTEDAYAHMEHLAGELAAGLQAVIDDRRCHGTWCAWARGSNSSARRARCATAREAAAAHAANAGTGHAPVAAEPGLPDRAVSQHDADVPGDDGAAGRVVAHGICRGRDGPARLARWSRNWRGHTDRDGWPNVTGDEHAHRTIAGNRGCRGRADRGGRHGKAGGLGGPHAVPGARDRAARQHRSRFRG